jgi:hypothetical protein
MAVIMLSPLRLRRLRPQRMVAMEDRTAGGTARTTAGRGRTSNEPTGSNAGGNGRIGKPTGSNAGRNGRIGTAKMLPLSLPRLFHPLPLGLLRRLRLTYDGKLSATAWGSRACESHIF